MLSDPLSRDSFMKFRISLGIAFLTLASLAAQPQAQAAHTGTASAASQFPLADGWMLQSSRKVDQAGDVLSKPTFQPKGWYPVTVPTTVVSALVKHKVLPDPTYGM